MATPKLSPRAVKFVDEYLVDLCAKDAALRAGYGVKAAKRTGSRLLQDERVQALIQRRKDMRAARVEVKQDDVLRELLRIATVDIAKAYDEQGRLLPLHDMPEDIRRAIAGVEVEELYEGRGEDREKIGDLVKVKFWDKPRALELLGKHLGTFADRVHVTGTVTVVHRKELLARVSAALVAAQPQPAPVAQA